MLQFYLEQTSSWTASFPVIGTQWQLAKPLVQIIHERSCPSDLHTQEEEVHVSGSDLLRVSRWLSGTAGAGPHGSRVLVLSPRRQLPRWQAQRLGQNRLGGRDAESGSKHSALPERRSVHTQHNFSRLRCGLAIFTSGKYNTEFHLKPPR